MLSAPVLALLFLVVLSLLGTLAYGALSAAPWVPLGRADTERLLHLAQLCPGELLYDLGCGDGRLLTAAAKRYGVRAVGFEIALLPYLLAQARIRLAGVGERVTVRYQSFWHVPFDRADAVVCFLTPQALQRLQTKIPSELKPSARFVTYAFKLKSLSPTFVSKPSPTATPIYLYTRSVQA